MAKILNFPDEFSDGMDKAQELVWDAWEAETPEESVKLAKKALKLDPNIIDAYNVLASNEFDPVKELALYQKAIENFEKQNGQKFFKEYAGAFWGIIETRPYMCALLGYGTCLWKEGDFEEAVRVSQRMLELNPSDNQGVRFLLINWLLILERYNEAHKLIDAYDGFGLGFFAGTLLLGIIEKEKKSALKKLYKTVTDYNPYAIPFILKQKRMTGSMPDHFALGSRDEALVYMKDEYGKLMWDHYPLAVQALSDLVK